MPINPPRQYQEPYPWTAFGHSYLNYSFGTYYQTGRADSIMRAALNIEPGNWRNFAINGARATTETPSTGGFARFLQRVNKPQRGGRYVADGGALLLCYGINDMGTNGTTVQIRTAYQHAMRTMISRWRASVIYENSFQVGTRTSYGAGFGQIGGTSAYASGTSVHWALSTTNAVVTCTLPSDYEGEPVALCFVGAGGAAAGTVTFGGTAGVTGTLNTSDIMPTSLATHCPVIARFTNLTAANAGQTITATVTSIDAGGAVMFDCWWLESKAAPPVVVCNIAKLNATGYTVYPGWAGTEQSRDAEVDVWNTALAQVVAEFDSMVQVADVDSALAKTYYSADGLHPDERGAARIVDAIRDAQYRLRPTSGSPSENMSPSAPRPGHMLRPHISGQWYTSEYQATSVSGYTPVVGHLWAIPFWVTESREHITRFAMQLGTDGTANTIRWGLYDDIGATGYPMERIAELTSGGAFSVSAGLGVKMSPASGTGSIDYFVDPGLYWLAMLVVTIGDGLQRFAAIQGQSMVMPNVQTNGNPFVNAAAFVTGWRLTGQATTALPTTFPTGATATANAPYIGAQVTINPTNYL